MYCRVCKAAGRPASHSFAFCDYVSRAEKREMIQSSRVDTEYLDEADEVIPESDTQVLDDELDRMEFPDDITQEA